jgi:hypothetical protein
VVFRVLVGLACASSACAIPALALAQPSSDDASYKRHMGNGVKLYQDKNFEAAIAEFSAAYRARPKASPLVNIALCEKALFRYPKAIAALERALAEHRIELDEGDQAAAQEAIGEMRSLLAYVTVKLTPRQAVLIVDGEEQPPHTADKPVPLGPGTHKIGARHDGYAPAEQQVSVVSGDRALVVTLALVADKGYVRVDAGDPRTVIVLDGRVVGRGRWAGLVAPGSHEVELRDPSGRVVKIPAVVTAGKALELGGGAGQASLPIAVAPSAPPTLPAPAPPQRRPPPRPPQRGPYGLLATAIYAPLTHPTGFSVNSDKPGWGAAFGVHGGYRPLTVLGVEAMYRYSHTSVSGVDDASGAAAKYTLRSHRVGAGLRLMSSGTKARFIATLHGGLTVDAFELGGSCRGLCDANGATGFADAEVGFELDLKGVLLGVLIEQSVSGKKHLARARGDFFSEAIIQFGAGLRVGYGAW